jgi:two-component system cell cycle sensor histidine kinase/response regulator CckA
LLRAHLSVVLLRCKIFLKNEAGDRRHVKMLARLYLSMSSPANPRLRLNLRLSDGIVEHSPDGIVAFDLSQRFVLWNAAMEEITGLSRDEVLGRRVFDMFPALQAVGEEKKFASALGGESFTTDERPYYIASTARRGYVETRYAPLRDDTGEIAGVLVILREVTQHRRATERLRETQNRFRSLFEEAPIAYHEIDRAGVVRRVNRAECELLGFSPKEILNRKVWDLVAPEQQELSRAAVRRKLGEEQTLGPFYRDYLRGDGTRLTLEVHEKLIRDSRGEVVGIRSALLDRTERMRAEERLVQACDELELRVEARTTELARANEALQNEVGEKRRAEQRLALQYAVARILAESSTFGGAAHAILRSICEKLAWNLAIFWSANPQTGLLECRHVWRNDGGSADPRVLNLTPEAGLAGWVWATREPCWIADITAEAEFPWGALTDRKEFRGGLVFPVLLANEVFAVLAFFSREVQPVDNELLKATSLIGSQIGQFIERKRTEEALLQSEKRFGEFMHHLPGVAFIKNLDGRYIYHNGGVETKAGRKSENICGKTDYDLFPPEVAALYRSNDRMVLESNFPVEVIETAPHEGEIHSWLVYKFPIPDSEGRMALVGGIGIDITERRQLEEQLRQSQKMEAIGRLAGGVAHDFNNLLTIISGYGRMVLDDIGAKHRSRVRVEEVLNAADRAAILTSQLLAFSRRQVVQPKVLELNHLISNLEKMLRRVIGEHIELVTNLSADLRRVKADAGQLEQVIMNLAVNARDAMPEGGKLTIETKNVFFRKEADLPDTAGSLYVMLTVTDTGVGMDNQTRTHLFEPFFTTKERGKGTGLGLSTVYGIVKQHGGEIRVESQLSAGAAFHIYFPVSEESSEPAEVSRRMDAAPVGTETILLVEDEAGVREFACETLKRGGYRVLEAADAQDAVILAEQEKGPIHLLLTDVIMPLVSGRELAEQIKSLREGIRVIYMSGYTDDVLAYRGDLGPDIDFLQKPFGPDVLARKIREVLER